MDSESPTLVPPPLADRTDPLSASVLNGQAMGSVNGPVKGVLNGPVTGLMNGLAKGQVKPVRK